MNIAAAARTGLPKNPRLRLACTVLVWAGLTLGFGCRSEQSPRFVPDFTLPQVRGGSFHLRAPPSHAVLLAFLQTVPDTANTPSRAEVPFLLSIAHQYAPHGLRVAVIDASALLNPHPPTHDAPVNASYDWQLDLPFLEDDRDRIARSVGVTQIPTLTLLAPDGSIRESWQGFTPPVVLAHAIEKLCGAPSARGSRLSQ